MLARTKSEYLVTKVLIGSDHSTDRPNGEECLYPLGV